MCIDEDQSYPYEVDLPSESSRFHNKLTVHSLVPEGRHRFYSSRFNALLKADTPRDGKQCHWGFRIRLYQIPPGPAATRSFPINDRSTFIELSAELSLAL